MEPVEAVERRPERDLRVQTPDLERGARVHFADFLSLYWISKPKKPTRNPEKWTFRMRSRIKI